VLEGKEEQQVWSFSSEDAPISVGIIFDMSGSMSTKIERAREAAIEFCKTANPEDEFFLITFADAPEDTSGFTNSVEELQGKLIYNGAKKSYCIAGCDLSWPQRGACTLRIFNLLI
jgi:Ca-activated chloride channel homolog